VDRYFPPGTLERVMKKLIQSPVGYALRGFAVVVALPAIGLAAAFGAESAAPSAREPGDLQTAGSVDFPVTCAPATKPEFVHGVALLHSFFYEEARRIFTSVAEEDPACAMAQWGIGMTWWHPIWTPPTPEEMSAGRAAAEKAMAMGGGTDLERGFIRALFTYYNTPDDPAADPVGQSCDGPVGPLNRVAAYEKAMREVYARYPDDFETQVFYALAVLSVGYATPADATLSNQLRAAGILENLWKKNPNHPGVAHYLIHSYDYPELAERGLPAARAYGAIAPWVPHALHMPSHIFTRLGMWDESIAANLAAAGAARAYAAKRHRQATESEELHGLDYLVYAYLQEAQDTKAKAVLTFVSNVRKTYPDFEFAAAYALAAIPARCALDRKAWAEAANLPIPALPHWSKFPFLEALFEYAHAMGRARNGDRDGARMAIDRMQRLWEAHTETKFEYFKMHLALQIQAASAWVVFSEGNKDEATDQLRRAADSEDHLGKHPVSPGALIPIREQLGDLLLERGRPMEALNAYEAALKIYPRRFQGLYGAGLSAERMGDKSTALRYYGKLAQQTVKADDSRVELAHVREFIGAIRETAPIATSESPGRD
jgi:tetratricopeptide (TPR) repeat protein